MQKAIFPFPVIPAQAGIQEFQVSKTPLDTRFRGYDDFLQVHHISKNNAAEFPNITSWERGFCLLSRLSRDCGAGVPEGTLSTQS